MPGYNFGKIGSLVRKMMDTDTMDIFRRTETINSDGTFGETMPDGALYQDVPCHIVFNSSDNPDPDSIDVKPIIISITIHCGVDTDLQNNDYIQAKKLDARGNVLEVYAGVIGFPTLHQSGQSAVMVVSKSGLEME